MRMTDELQAGITRLQKKMGHANEDLPIFGRNSDVKL